MSYGGDFLGEIVEHIVRQPRWQPAGKYFRMSVVVVGVDTELAALHRKASGMSEGRSKHRRFAPRREAIRGISGGAGANCEGFAGARPLKRELGLEDLGARVRLRALADRGSRVVHPHPVTSSEIGDRAECVREG